MTDIVSAITRFLTPELVEKISSAADLDRASGQMAIEAVIPAILSGLAELADGRDGASRLARAVAAQPSDVLPALAGNVDELTTLEVGGGRVLSALFGESVVGKMAWVVGSYTGIGERPARTLMNLLMPVIMGILGKEQRASGLDVEGLSRLLSNERQRIAAAMPAGLAELLEDELHEKAVPRSSLASRWSAGALPSDTTMQRVMSDSGERDVARGEWSAWALPVLVALGFVWWYSLIWWLLLPSSPPRVAETPRAGQTVTATAQSVSNTAPTFITKAADDWVSINGYFNKEIYSRSGEMLGTIEDVLIRPDGRFNAVVVAINQALGIGSKDIAVPFTALHLERRGAGARLILDTTMDALQNAPAFEVRPMTRK